MIHLRDTECSGLGVGGWEKNVYQENNIYELYIYISTSYVQLFSCSNRRIRCDYLQLLTYYNSCVQTVVHRMPVLKRPSSAGLESAKKRPASSIASVVAEMKENAKEDPNTEDPGSDVRHKGKGEKFNKLLRAGQLPAQIVHMWEHGAASSGMGERAYKTKLVNTLMKQQSDGSYLVDTDCHMYKRYQEVYETHLSRDQQKAVPRGIMLASYFHGDEALMNKSIASGELKSTKDPKSGVEFLSFRSLKIEDIKGNTTREQVENTKKISKGQALEMTALMKKLKWNFNFSKVIV